MVLFSEWTTMLDLIEPLLNKNGMDFVRLDGSVAQKNREPLVQEFQTNDRCRAFLTTNAGSTGLNLQAANTVVNVNLPWNPAVLEQRIARAHRMGQTQPVQVFVLITEATLEENLLLTLSAKRDLALAALDSNSDVDTVSLVTGADELRARLEVLLGASRRAPPEQSIKRQEENGAPTSAARRERVAAAGGGALGCSIPFSRRACSGWSNVEPAPECGQ